MKKIQFILGKLHQIGLIVVLLGIGYFAISCTDSPNEAKLPNSSQDEENTPEDLSYLLKIHFPSVKDKVTEVSIAEVDRFQDRLYFFRFKLSPQDLNKLIQKSNVRSVRCGEHLRIPK